MKAPERFIRKIRLKAGGLQAQALSLFALSVILLCISCSGKNVQTAPLLVIAGDSGFGKYTGEILKAEGFNEYATASPGTGEFDLTYLRTFDVVILAAGVVSGDEASMLFKYVKGGGNLIAFRPSEMISSLFGIRMAAKTVSEGYIRIDTTALPGAGLTGTTIQYHGISDVYETEAGSTAAILYETSEKSAGSPAVLTTRFGKGHFAAFSYDLPLSIVYTRQGNPEWAGEERDHIDGPTATDLFFPEDHETQWNDPSRIAVPQADEQMRLLTHIIEQFTSEHKPLPRLWYFPENLKCVFIFTIDGEDTPEKDINGEISEVQAKGASATLFEIGTYIPAATVERWRSGGHEVSVHYNDVPNYASPDYQNMSEVYERMTRDFTSAYGLVPRTSRNHWAVWCSKDPEGKKEFAQQAMIEEKHGIQLDCNYYQFGGNNVYPNFLGDAGHFTGSGIPMRFASSYGKIIDVFQSNTQLADETWLKPNVEAKGKMLIDRSIDDGHYAWINANFHTWYWPECREAGLRILDHCKDRGVPVFTAERVNNFIRAKDEASFSGINWRNGILTFSVKSTVRNRDRLSVILPASHGKHDLSGVTMDGSPVSLSFAEIKGTRYVSVPFEPGSDHVFTVRYD